MAFTPFQRRATVRGVFRYVLPALIVLALLFNVVQMYRSKARTYVTYSNTFSQRADGTFWASQNALPVVASATLKTGAASGPTGVSSQEPSWLRTGWTLDIQSGLPLTQAQRAEIATLIFRFTGQPVPHEALTEAPAPGSAATSGTSVRINGEGMLMWVLTGTPGYLFIAWLVTGLALWLTRHQQRNTALCPHCDYDRSGLGSQAVCPECGNSV